MTVGQVSLGGRQARVMILTIHTCLQKLIEVTLHKLHVQFVSCPDIHNSLARPRSTETLGNLQNSGKISHFSCHLQQHDTRQPTYCLWAPL